MKCQKENEKPPRVPCRLKAAPRIRELYWCDFPKDAQLPEFWKTRPVIVISKTCTLSGTVSVIPCSTVEQTGKWTCKLATTVDGKESWAVCDKLTTVSVSRLHPPRGRIRLPDGEFQNVIRLMLDYLPKA
jgi:mRNA interferase MazF